MHSLFQAFGWSNARKKDEGVLFALRASSFSRRSPTTDPNAWKGLVHVSACITQFTHGRAYMLVK